MEKYSETELNIRKQRIDHLNTRWGQLYHLQKDWGEKSIRYILMTNAGGAIATLSFLGTSDNALLLPAVKVALFLFIFGVFLIGVITAKTVHGMSYLFKNYKIGVDDYFSDKISWAHFCEEDNKRAVDDIWDYIIPYASFGCFIFGSIAGACALFGSV